MVDKRNKMIDKSRFVWMCINCDHKVISGKRPEFCPRCNDKKEFVLIDNLIVTK